MRETAKQGAQVVLLLELFELPYFWCEQDVAHFQQAQPFENTATVAYFSSLAAELKVVLPVSFFERAGSVCYNRLLWLMPMGRCWADR